MNRRRIATHNIYDGAAVGRAEGQIALLTDLNLLILTEAVGLDWAEGGKLRREHEARLGMWSRGRLKYRDGDGSGHHTVIFGRRIRTYPGCYKPLGPQPRNRRGTGLLGVTTDGYPHVITVLDVHAHTLDPAVRLSEARHTARCSIGLRSGPAIYAGDMNSLYAPPTGAAWRHLPAADPEPDWDRLPPELRLYHWLLDQADNPVIGDDGRMVSDRRPAKALCIAGFHDAIATLLPPQERPPTGGHGPDDAPRRLDQIWMRHLTPIDCATLNDPDTVDLSDHSPVWADIDLDSS